MSTTTTPKAADTGRAGRVTPRQLALWEFTALGLIVVLWTQFGTGPTSAVDPLWNMGGAVESWAAITVAVAIQALPFLVLGVTVSAVIAAFAPPGFLQRITPRNSFLAVPVAGSVAIALPGCECASVPVAQSFMRNGVSGAAALVFMLASPALNPVVIVSTAVAFNALPEMAWARFIASFLAVLTAGWLWIILGRDDEIRVTAPDGAGFGGCADDHCTHDATGSGKRSWQWRRFQMTALHDLTQAGGFLVLGAMVAALIKVTVPASWFADISQTPLLAVLVMVGLAILLSLCSEADAFVAASFTAVSPTAQLAFLVVGPMVDIKLISMQAGAFGTRFVLRFVPMVLICGVLSAVAVGAVIFGVL
ncbi:permease [Corynebacterium sp. TAE3-ERU16]|uniref:permease n=1 Tax=Corynebacterium sp. TAE3-ERU16 TaxID=2849493 RepID=UPI00351D6BF9